MPKKPNVKIPSLQAAAKDDLSRQEIDKAIQKESVEKYNYLNRNQPTNNWESLC